MKYMLRRSKYKRLSTKTSVQIAIQLVDRFAELHSCGYLHCNLQPETVLMGSNQRNKVESSRIILSNFSLSQKWRDADSKHVPPAAN